LGTPANPQANLGDNISVGAGDIADCKCIDGAQATAALLATIPGTIFAADDAGCPDGTEENFLQRRPTLQNDLLPSSPIVR
jgi:hypothetical protein